MGDGAVWGAAYWLKTTSLRTMPGDDEGWAAASEGIWAQVIERKVSSLMEGSMHAEKPRGDEGHAGRFDTQLDEKSAIRRAATPLLLSDPYALCESAHARMRCSSNPAPQ